MHFPNNLMMIYHCNYSPASETSLSFRGDGDASTGTDSFSKPDKTRSCIFMEGDYNMTTRNVEGRFITTQKRDFAGLPAAGISTVTRTPYSHVTPKYIAEMSTVQCNMFFNACRESPQCAVSALRKLLIAKNEEEFQNPRDPTTVNVVKAFATYDQQK